MQKIIGQEVIEQIEAIVIPDDFISAVLKFQTEQHDSYPSVTDNEYGRAYGKILLNDVTGKHTVFIDSMLAAFIMEDNFFNECFRNLDEVHLASAKQNRQISLNILAHELSHVELALILNRPKAYKSLHSILLHKAINLFDEYYACRKAGSLFPMSLAEENEQFILDIEDKIDEERWKYKTHKQSLNQFCSVFHQYSEMTLIRLASVLGEYAAEGKDSLPFPNSIAGKQAEVFKTCFDQLFSHIANREKIDSLEYPTTAIGGYFRDLGVEISDATKGLYYSIPD